MAGLSQVERRFYLHLGAAVKRRRDDIGMTAKQLAMDIGMTRGGLSKFENGYSAMPVHRLVDVAHFLLVPVGELLAAAEVVVIDG